MGDSYTNIKGLSGSVNLRYNDKKKLNNSKSAGNKQKADAKGYIE